MKYLLSALLIVSVTAWAVDLQGIGDIMELERRSLSSVNSCEIQAEFVSHLIAFAPEHPRRDFPGSLHYCISDGKYLYEMKQVDLAGKQADEIGAFNGEYFQRLKRDSGTLYLTKGDAEVEFLRFKNAFWLPYFPFLRAWREERSRPPRLADFRDAGVWRKIAEETTRVDEISVDGFQCLSITVPGGDSSIGGPMTRYEIALAKELGYLPIEWKWKGEKGNTLEAYKVKKVGKVEVRSMPSGGFFFAKEAAMTCCDPKDPDKILTALDIVIKDIKINEAIADDIFSIDPAQAERIYDAATNTVVPVPR